MSHRIAILGAAFLLDTCAFAVASDCARTSVGLTPLNELATATYQGEEGGLYPGASNARPAAHDADLVRVGQPIPLDAAGSPDPVGGKIGFISCGMSNATQEFSVFKPRADAYADKNPKVVIVDCAQGGQTAAIIQNPTAAYWATCDSRIAAAGLTNAQVQVVWIKEADAGPTSGWPVYAQTLRDELGRILQVLDARYPNTRSAYLSSRIYAGYASSTLNPEPYAYESGYSVKWLVADQLAGDPRYNFDPARGAVNAPWIAWGPYLWGDGLTPRSDGLAWDCADFTSDGTHPATLGRSKVADLLLDFFRSDASTVPWFLTCRDTAPGEVPELTLTKQPAGTELAWTSLDPAAGAATVYDIVHGTVASLRAGRGFGGGACLVSDVPDTPHRDAVAAASNVTWYRVRARNSCAPGGWGDAGLDGGAIRCP